MSWQNDGICFLFVIDDWSDFCVHVWVVSSCGRTPPDIIKAITLTQKVVTDFKRILRLSASEDLVGSLVTCSNYPPVNIFTYGRFSKKRNSIARFLQNHNQRDHLSFVQIVIPNRVRLVSFLHSPNFI